MDWSNEEYVRLYTRETADDLELSWEALALWRAMLCKFDRSGVIPVRNGWPSIARMVRMPVDVVERAGPELVTDGRVRVTKHGLVAPNFTEAQTASKSDKLRQRESRDRRRDVALGKPGETTRVSHERSRTVTKRDTKSRDVTLPLPPDTTAPVALPPVIPPPQAVTAARRLLDRVVTNTPTSTVSKLSESEKQRKAEKWGDAFRLLHDRDGHSWEDINAMIDWCQEHHFWKSNILSGDKLREKWDQLAARRASENGGGDSRYGRGRIATREELDEDFEQLKLREPGMAGGS